MKFIVWVALEYIEKFHKVRNSSPSVCKAACELQYNTFGNTQYGPILMRIYLSYELHQF